MKEHRGPQASPHQRIQLQLSWGGGTWAHIWGLGDAGLMGQPLRMVVTKRQVWKIKQTQGLALQQSPQILANMGSTIRAASKPPHPRCGLVKPSGKEQTIRKSLLHPPDVQPELSRPAQLPPPPIPAAPSDQCEFRRLRTHF